MKAFQEKFSGPEAHNIYKYRKWRHTFHEKKNSGKRNNILDFEEDKTLRRTKYLIYKKINNSEGQLIDNWEELTFEEDEKWRGTQ